METVKTKNSLSNLLEISQNIALLQTIDHLLSWDQETYMPAKAITIRAKQLEYLSGLIHEEQIKPKFKHSLSEFIDLDSGQIKDPSLTEIEKANLRLWRKEYLKTVKLPLDFIKEFAELKPSSISAWQSAKEKNDFSIFLPYLEKIISLSRKKADFIGYKEHPYDALIDYFEPDAKTKEFDTLFTSLKKSLIHLLQKMGKKQPSDSKFLYLFYPKEKQLHFSNMILKKLGFSEDSSRLDLTSHPMCLGIHPHDTRLTTRIYPNSITENIFSVIHEAGHGLYHMGLPNEFFATPIYSPLSYGFDESQSRMWETIIGKSPPFWKHFFPILQQEFPENLKTVKMEQFYQAINLVKPTMIRTSSDEITYNLHIILRFEMEKMMMEGELEAKDIPEIWNEKMKNYLGIVPKNDSEGCLQDIHWSMGAFGYFPTYTLGNLYAAQLFSSFAQSDPNWPDEIARGEFQSIQKWFKENLYQFGKIYSSSEMIRKITNRPLSPEPFIHYLENKFLT
ncbi:MAG: carboxypeptidase M32 [Chlamydiae bacterium]|nr:carboxypeptidase M32 [Chlamydiota bacterium]